MINGSVERNLASLINNQNGVKLPRGKRKKIGRYLLAGFLILLVFVFGRRPILGLVSNYLVSQNNQAVKGEQTPESQKITIDKKFTFLGIDETGEKEDELNLTISEVEKTDQVIVQEKTYTAKNNKTFLIVNLEILNDATKRLNIFPGDLIRLIVDGDEEKMFAPDLHNNYVLVAPISTKIDRIGFVIDSQSTDLKLQVGDLDEKKEVIELKF